MEEAKPPVVSRGSVDKSSGSLIEREEYPEDFRKLLHTELNLSRLEDFVGESHVTGRVFWSRQDDRIPTVPPSVSDCVSENVNVIPDFSPKVKDKIRLALGRILLHPRYGQSLVQFWAATKIEGRTLLTTQNQPFALGKTGRSTWGLCEYRMKSMEYKFYGDIGDGGEEELGLPGRVFLHKLPESAPDVQYYSLKEFPQRDDAFHCQVRASWALPVFEHSSQVCVGVLELVSAVDAIRDWHDKSFLHNLYAVLQELGLQSIDVYKHYEMKDDDKALTTAFHELSLVLESVNKSHKLPLALTWVLCNACDALLLGRCSSEGGEYLGAFKANDDRLLDFLIASTGYHLRKGQVAERVLAFPNMLYCSDVTKLSIAEYPLVPFARQCKLSGWFTICLQSSNTGNDIYVLEFFWPASSKDNENIPTRLSLILGTMEENFKTFKLASGQELGEELSVEVINFQNGQRHQYVEKIQASLALLKNGGMTLQMSSVIGVDDGMDLISAEQDDTVTTISEGGTTKTQQRELNKTGVRFDISLDDVLQFSALRRRDAARGLKVSESTLKRVCRKHGIHRWPPRDINKEEVFPLALPNVGDTAHLHSPEELKLDATIVVPCLEEGIITKLKREKRKTGVRIEISLEDILQCSKMKLDDAARKLNVSSSTLKRVCRDNGIHRWPPRKIDKKFGLGLKCLDGYKPYEMQGGGFMLQLGELGQPSTDAIHSGMKVVSEEQNCVLPSLEALQNGEVTMELDSPHQPPFNPSNKGHNVVATEENIIGVSLDDILKCVKMDCKRAAEKLKVSISTFNGACREYGINRWPPLNIDNVSPFRPSPIVNQRQIPQLISDLPSNQALAGVAHINPGLQDANTVTIRAKYENNAIKFRLSLLSRYVELQQEVAKRLNLEAGTYHVKYKDEEDELILITCDEDLQDCMHTSRSQGNTSIVVLLEPK